MAEWLGELPLVVVAAGIFCLRLIDVTMGTMRTLSIVHGRTYLAVSLGFVEVTLWVTALATVIARVTDDPILVVAYGGGFAAGNAAGISLERALALGKCVVRIISSHKGDEIAGAIRGVGQMVTTFQGREGALERTLVYAICERRGLGELVSRARTVDPDLFYAVERFPQMSPLSPSFQPTGWRSVLKKK